MTPTPNTVVGIDQRIVELRNQREQLVVQLEQKADVGRKKRVDLVYKGLRARLNQRSDAFRNAQSEFKQLLEQLAKSREELDRCEREYEQGVSQARQSLFEASANEAEVAELLGNADVKRDVEFHEIIVAGPYYWDALERSRYDRNGYREFAHCSNLLISLKRVERS